LVQPISELSVLQREILLDSLLELIYKLNQAGIIKTQRMCFSCSFHSKEQETHSYNLLQKTLKNNELRLDCPEHCIKNNIQSLFLASTTVIQKFVKPCIFK